MLLLRILGGGWQKINTFDNTMSDIVAGDKHGNGVAEGDIVKVSRRKELYKIRKIIEIDDGWRGESYPVFELEPIQPVTIFRGEHQIELYEE